VIRETLLERGWARVPGAFSADEAAAMRDATWTELERQGIRRDEPRTWRNEAPSHLQKLKHHPAFAAVASTTTTAAIDAVLGCGRWKEPNDWGAFFLLFPNPRPWTVPHKAWHLDAPYGDPLDPPSGLKVHALYGDIEPRAGGMTIVSGSHRLVAAWAAGNPDKLQASGASIRKAVVRDNPYLRDLSVEGGDPDDRIARFVDTEEIVDGVPLRVVELTAKAGDVILMHPLLLHTRPTNAGREPRFLLNKDLRASAA
jgi:hypothetical protein